MPKMLPLSDEVVDELLAERPPSVSRWIQENAHEEDFEIAGASLQICQWCGYCPDPDHCVWGVQCPKCFAPQMQQCTESDGRVTGLHQERWDYAKGRE